MAVCVVQTHSFCSELTAVRNADIRCCVVGAHWRVVTCLLACLSVLARVVADTGGSVVRAIDVVVAQASVGILVAALQRAGSVCILALRCCLALSLVDDARALSGACRSACVPIARRICRALSLSRVGIGARHGAGT